MATAGQKDPDALLTIGELSQELGVAQHILRYWESKFPQLKPLQRAGNRRYYRPADVALARRIHRLLNEEGYTVKGVQKVLRSRDSVEPAPAAGTRPVIAPPAIQGSVEPARPEPVDVQRLRNLRNRLAMALED